MKISRNFAKIVAVFFWKGPIVAHVIHSVPCLQSQLGLTFERICVEKFDARHAWRPINIANPGGKY